MANDTYEAQDCTACVDLSKRDQLKKTLAGVAVIGAGLLGLSSVANADIIFRDSSGEEKRLSDLGGNGVDICPLSVCASGTICACDGGCIVASCDVCAEGTVRGCYFCPTNFCFCGCDNYGTNQFMVCSPYNYNTSAYLTLDSCYGCVCAKYGSFDYLSVMSFSPYSMSPYYLSAYYFSMYDNNYYPNSCLCVNFYNNNYNACLCIDSGYGVVRATYGCFDYICGGGGGGSSSCFLMYENSYYPNCYFCVNFYNGVYNACLYMDSYYGSICASCVSTASCFVAAGYGGINAEVPSGCTMCFCGGILVCYF